MGTDNTQAPDGALRAALELLDKATPGRLTPGSVDGTWCVAREADTPRGRGFAVDGETWNEADAVLIAAAVNLLRDHGPALLAALARPSAAPASEARDGAPDGWHDVLDRARAQLGSAGGVGVAGSHNTQIELAVGGPIIDWIDDELTALAAAPKPAAETGSTGAYTLEQIEDAWGAAVPLSSRNFDHFRKVLAEMFPSATPTQDAAHGGRDDG